MRDELIKKSEFMPVYTFRYIESTIGYIIRVVDSRFVVSVNFVNETARYHIWITEAGDSEILWSIAPPIGYRNGPVSKAFKLELPVRFCETL